ncbi:hypothetical protein Lfu02_77570 [Longispora fulva]|uniref:Suppressor of fused-like domain-containing protein n=1 Tax=Longispora fulva TaxID=619741 RepID=A0A8J7GE28_9ACTN|nr:suppressor of fused domain protein [Longispora fulva]MBG6136205.1 hypothetical protein [Longispora fulva]GIG63385.1 hypothetical protein Lfu02_77570 [Longispora fulva]
MATRVEKYLAHLDRMTGGAEPRFLPVPSTKNGLENVTVMAYPGLPEGLLTAVTYGLSLAEHPEWRHGTPELCISVSSSDELWARAIGHLAEGLRGSCPFAYGDTVGFGGPISPESAMTAFVVAAPAVMDRTDYAGIDVSAPGHEGHDVINIAGMYPIHEIERKFIREHGPQAFWEIEWDPCNVTRPPAV